MIVSTVPECKLLMNGKSESDYLTTVSAPMKANQFILAKVSIAKLIIYVFLFCSYIDLLSFVTMILFERQTFNNNLFVFYLCISGFAGIIVSVFKLVALYWASSYDDDEEFTPAYHKYCNFVEMHFILFTMYCTSFIFYFFFVGTYNTYVKDKLPFEL